jgi:preprotein translocase subunit SecD
VRTQSHRYPIWKILVLIGLVVIGLIYAVPNLYGEDPAIQVSPKSDNVDIPILKNTLISSLETNHIPYRGITVNTDSVEIRFPNTDTQILAQDAFKKSLNTADYTIALNLAPTTPRWLQMIGANPMKLGLDLQGGIHFLLEVDVDSIINRHYQSLIKNIMHTLRDKHIRYQDIQYIPHTGIHIGITPEYIQETRTLIMEIAPDVGVATEPNGINVSLTPDALHSITQNTVEQTMGILRNRVNELGIGEAVVQQQGENRIAVDLPGVQDAAHAKEILGGTATLEFHLVADTDPLHADVTPPDTKWYTIHGQPLLLHKQVVLSGDSIISANSSFDTQSASPAVQIQATGGEHMFSKITRDNIGKRMAIVFVETKTDDVASPDGKTQRTTHREERVISAPVIQTALGNQFQITGLRDIKEAGNLSLLLRAGALPATIYPIEERTVGPSLGKENIERGLISLEVGMICILFVMVLYYRVFGWIADIGLFLNVIMLGALLSMIGATLTLPGIAGFVLTVGMAVDANVLIYERIREELRRGISAQAAIQAGYSKAFATIVDANLTTLIVAIVLFTVGTGPIKGFAIILALGLLTSVLTSVTYTRAMVHWYYGRKNVKKLSIGI